VHLITDQGWACYVCHPEPGRPLLANGGEACLPQAGICFSFSHEAALSRLLAGYTARASNFRSEKASTTLCAALGGVTVVLEGK